MSPRHFAKAMASKTYRDPIADKLQPGMNLWFAFFSITGIDKSITKLFVFTPKEMNINPVKDSQSGIQITSD
jgi:hypothetical protein